MFVLLFQILQHYEKGVL